MNTIPASSFTSLFTTWAAVVVLTAGLAGAAAAAEPLPIVAGSTVVADLTRQIGGAHVSVHSLVAPGIDPHTYQPTPDDAKRLATAKLVVLNGLGFEGWAEGLLKESHYAGTVVEAAKGVDLLQMDAEEEAEAEADAHPGHAHVHGEKVTDPHAFNDPLNGVKYAENIRDALTALDAANSAEYQKNAAKVVAELRQIDAWAKKEFAVLPPEARKLVTNHDAMQYFAKQYGFAISAPQTALEDSTPSAKELAELVTFIKAQKVKGVFLEAGKDPKLIEQIAREAGVKLGADLWLDGLNTPGTEQATYQGMLKSNINAIVAALK